MRAGRGRQRQGAARGPQAAALGRRRPPPAGRPWHDCGSTAPSTRWRTRSGPSTRSTRPQKAKDAPQIAAVFRRDFEAMDDRLFRKYGARLQLPNDAASSDDDSSDDEAEAVLASPGGFAALAGGCGDLPARPVFS